MAREKINPETVTTADEIEAAVENYFQIEAEIGRRGQTMDDHRQTMLVKSLIKLQDKIIERVAINGVAKLIGGSKEHREK